ncbi:hypothetical protein F4861DRAFT_540834 [Xylaria intraflava]|nr:hypothetical protein F4861DRAFT_540834 [Xylaria intraflava]
MDHDTSPAGKECGPDRNYLLPIVIALGVVAGLFVLAIIILTCGWPFKRDSNGRDVEIGELKSHQSSAGDINPTVVIWPETPAVTDHPKELTQPNRPGGRPDSDAFEDIDISSVHSAQAVPIIQIHRASSELEVPPVRDGRLTRSTSSIALRTVDVTPRQLV